MTFSKTHMEFHALDMDAGWRTPDGYPPGIEEKILSSNFDEDRQQGSRTRLLRFQPKVFTTKPFVHDYWEEVYLLNGDLAVGSDEHGFGGAAFGPHTYACRPPGVYHGPFRSEGGCLLLEIHYYERI